MKKLKILLLVVLIGVTSYLGTFSSTLNVDAANNECDENYTLKTYINNLGYSISGNTVSYTGAKGLLYSTSFDSTINAADPDGNFSFVVPDENLADRIEVHFYLAQDDGVCETNKDTVLASVFRSTCAGVGLITVFKAESLDLGSSIRSRP